MTTWTELSRRAQDAKGPDRELDRDVHAAAGLDMKRRLHVGAVWNAYSGSVDAVLALISEKLPGWSASLSLAEGLKYPCVTMGRSYPTNKTVAMEAATPALALFAAFCMAMGATTEEPAP